MLDKQRILRDISHISNYLTVINTREKRNSRTIQYHHRQSKTDTYSFRYQNQYHHQYHQYHHQYQYHH